MKFSAKVLIGIAASTPLAASAQTVISINAAANRHAINPNVYGAAFPGTGQAVDLNLPIARYGGNSSSTYNWNANGDNRGSDWFFQSIPDNSATPGERGDTFFSTNKAAGTQSLLTIPMVPYVAKIGPNRSYLWSYSVAKYGPQTSTDYWHPDSGNGISTAAGNPYITGNNPLDAFVANTSTLEQGWVQHLISMWGNAASGGVKYYVMDNEPSLWNSTHRDIHPVGETYTEIYNDYLSYAGMIRAQDPNAIIVGPEEWGWTGYFYSGYDAAYGAAHGWIGPFPDRTSHGNMDHIPWLLQNLKAYQTSTGKQLLNVLSVHYYPQQGEFGNDDSAGMQAIRNRSTRSLWDPNYTDTSWIGSIVELIPRLKTWVSTYYPGLQTAITEYNWGDEGAMNGATAQADVDGIFGREGLDMGSRWTVPATGSPAYLAMKMYRNYDGNRSTFGDTSVQCVAPNPDSLAAFASVRTSDGALTVMVINKATSAAPIKLDMAGFIPAPNATVYQISSATQTSISSLGSAAIFGGGLKATVPAQSVTLYVIPKTTGAQFDFDFGTEGWLSTAPIQSISAVKTQHFATSYSLAVNISGPAGTALAYAPLPAPAAGNTVTFHVWIPVSNAIASIQPYVQQGAGGNWTWTGTWMGIGSLKTGAWNTITVTVPSNAVMPLYQLGVQFTTNAAWTGTCYIDTVGW